MSRFTFSMLVWTGFVLISASIIKFGFYVAEIPMDWSNAFWFAFVVRFLFLVNDGYRRLEKELGI